MSVLKCRSRNKVMDSFVAKRNHEKTCKARSIVQANKVESVEVESTPTPTLVDNASGKYDLHKSSTTIPSCFISISFSSLGIESSESIRAESPFWESSPDEYYLNLQRHFFSVALGVRCIPALSCQNYADVLRICRDNYIKNREETKDLIV